jgi:methionine synthase / methylenetetrahydrofolate reductase (NADH)
MSQTGSIETTMDRPLRDVMSDNRVHVLDGAMGTMLYSRGVFVNVCYDELNISEPDLIREVHEAYVRAGAEIIETNTFGANPVKLSSHGLDGETEEINRTAVLIAHRAAGHRSHVVGAIGPLGIRIEPWGPTSREEAVQLFARQATGLIDGGVHGFMLETFSDVHELECAIAAVRSLSSLPIFAQVTVDAAGNTSYGTSVEAVVSSLANREIDVMGFNCSVGPASMLDAVERLAGVTTLPISAQPNAGMPRAVGDRKIYMASPEYMAQYARRMIDAGVRFVGGCCGTTPDHIRQIGDYVASMQPRISSSALVRPSKTSATVVEPTPIAQRSDWGKLLASGQRVVTVELIPPRGWDPEELLTECRALKGMGIDHVHVVDAHGATMSAVAAALIINREVGMETIAHYTCRDKNMLGMVRDLLGAAASGLRNLLVDTGAPPTAGPYPDAKAVFDIDSIGLTNVINGLNHGIDPGGSPIGEPTRYVIGVVLNSNPVDMEREIERCAWKIDAGADFIVTQPVFEPQRLFDLLDRTGHPDIPVIANVRLLDSLRDAEFLANEVPGMRIPTKLIERMRAAQEKGGNAAHAEGFEIARELHDALRDRVRGFHFSAAPGSGASLRHFLGSLATTRVH